MIKVLEHIDKDMFQGTKIIGQWQPKECGVLTPYFFCGNIP